MPLCVVYPTFSSTSVQNQAAMESLAEELVKDPENTFPKKTIKCKNYGESKTVHAFGF